MDHVALAYAGLGIVCLALAVGTISGFLAPRVIDRWKKEADRADLTRLNLYTH